MISAMPDPRISEAASGMALDAATVEVVDALAAHGIRAILIKGAAIAARLYDDRSQRPYRDADLLVARDQFAPARQVLAELGFSEVSPEIAEESPRHDSAWHRAGALPATIDLHRWLYWCADDPDALWSVLSAGTGRLALAGGDVEILSDPAQLLVIAAHVIQHPGEPTPLADLGRAIALVGLDAWSAASELARTLDATGVFVAGLARSDGGARLIAELGLSDRAPPEMQLWIDAAPPASFAFMRIAGAGSRGAQARMAVRKVLPTPSFIRGWLPSTGHPSLPLPAAYPYRWWWLARRLPGGFRAWRRAVRAARSS
jgi:hypothetical protein